MLKCVPTNRTSKRIKSQEVSQIYDLTIPKRKHLLNKIVVNTKIVFIVVVPNECMDQKVRQRQLIPSVKSLPVEEQLIRSIPFYLQESQIDRTSALDGIPERDSGPSENANSSHSFRKQDTDIKGVLVSKLSRTIV